MFDLSGKKVLVTGGSRGIGRGICLAMAKVGADVAVNYAASENEAEQVIQEIKKMGRQAITIRADVSQKKEVEFMVDEVTKQFSKIDILVNNAGILSYAPFLEMTEETWDKMIAVNLKGQFLVAQAAAKQMVKQGKGGRIINIASIASGQIGTGFPNLAHYCATKGGIIAMTEAMALELSPQKINVNAIAPGVIETDMTKTITMDEKAKQGMLLRIPKGRMGKPEDIAAMAVFLASDEADYCTGATFYVDGGWLAG
ncbi:MAG: 3-oxoacyl-ACP reductase FabG [Patescibacteria group bacterium]|nr:3-oxoacyl-ACP reductase FabG [Patescibacteria group bacterium]MCL5095749.1 3-oxoacyl-ACP reductase FabG [Patescibacteria group bacterium]